MTKSVTKKKRNKGGRPRVKIDDETFRGLAAIQCTVEEFAAAFGCTKRTMLRRLAEPKYAEMLETGKALGRVSLRRLQWRHARGSGSSAVNMTIHLSKHHLGEHDRQINVNATVEDLDAAIAQLERARQADGAAADGGEHRKA